MCKAGPRLSNCRELGVPRFVFQLTGGWSWIWGLWLVLNLLLAHVYAGSGPGSSIQGTSRAALGMECLKANGFMVSGALSPPVFLLDLQCPNAGANMLVDKARTQS